MPTPFDVALPSGETLKGYFWSSGAPKKNLVILTGMNEYALRYDDLASYFNKKGINVYVLDSFGQGLNAKSVEEQEQWPVDGFSKNVDAANLLIERIKKESKLPTCLMGHSMGSFMAQSYVERYPNTAERVILCGSNGPALAKMKMGYALSKLIVRKSNWNKPSKFLSNMGLGAYTKAVKPRKTDLDWLSYNEENVKRYIADPYCGHQDTQGFWKEFLKGMSHLYEGKMLKKLSPKEKIFIVAGDADPVGNNGKGPNALYKMYQKRGLKNVTIKIYPHMRHEIHNETGHQGVYDDFLQFLLG
jgi:alpha-beta hydrolase superfamily lysophospholipase